MNWCTGKCSGHSNRCNYDKNKRIHLYYCEIIQIVFVSLFVRKLPLISECSSEVRMSHVVFPVACYIWFLRTDTSDFYKASDVIHTRLLERPTRYSPIQSCQRCKSNPGLYYNIVFTTMHCYRLCRGLRQPWSYFPSGVHSCVLSPMKLLGFGWMPTLPLHSCH